MSILSHGVVNICKDRDLTKCCEGFRALEGQRKDAKSGWEARKHQIHGRIAHNFCNIQ